MPVNITEEFVRFLMKQNEELSAHIDELSVGIASLNQTIRKLKEQLNKNSKNSSKQPSFDGLKKPTVKRIAVSVNLLGKSRVLQKGHDGVHLAVISIPDHVMEHMHSDCTGCPYRVSYVDKACIKETRYEVDAVVSVDVTAYNLIEVRECPMHGGVKTVHFQRTKKS